MDEERLAEIRLLLAEVEDARKFLRSLSDTLGRGERAPVLQAAIDLLAEVDRLNKEYELQEGGAL